MTILFQIDIKGFCHSPSLHHQFNNKNDDDKINYCLRYSRINNTHKLFPCKKALVNNIEQPVYEIAVRQVKDGKKADFEAARTAFIEKLAVQKGVSNDREFSSFYSLPTPDKLETFIGMTQYRSFKTPKKFKATWV